jgi:hypothetical protein
MSQPLLDRRNERNREPRRLYGDEQAYSRFQEEARAEIARLVREAAATAEPSDSDESDLPSGDGSSSENEGKAQPNNENIEPWSQQLLDVHPPVCSVLPTVALPRHRPSTELGYLQSFIDPSLIDTFVTTRTCTPPLVKRLHGIPPLQRRCGVIWQCVFAKVSFVYQNCTITGKRATVIATSPN